MSKLSFPTFAKGKVFGHLQPFRAGVPLIPYCNTYHAHLCDPYQCEEAKKWFPLNEMNDILLTSYPKCGHHFTQKICLEIIKMNHDGKYCPDLYKSGDLGMNTNPFIEYYVSQCCKQEILDRIESTKDIYPRLYFTNHSMEHIPVLPETLTKDLKIITTIRNPKDCIVSSWKYFSYIMKQLGHDSELHEFDVKDQISYFVRGIMTYGDYFKWYETYWNALNKQNYNILWLYYEDLIDNPLDNIKKIAEFMFDGNDIQNKPHQVLNISDDGFLRILNKIKIENVRKEISNNPQTFELGDNFFRKGMNNDWKNYFDETDSELVDETMYFKWAENGADIKYYTELMEKYNDKHNKGYFKDK